MNILIGVDTKETYKASLRLCERLKFPSPTYTFAHSVEAIVPLANSSGPGQIGEALRYANIAHTEGKRVLERACWEAIDRGSQAKEALLTGNAAGSLMKFADNNHIDLIAVHSQRKGTLGSFFLGSVSRGLAISSNQSVLISKGEISSEGPVNAVLATDHSAYSHCALEKILDMAPAGLKKIHVLTSVYLNDDDPTFSGSSRIPIEKQLVEEARRKVARVADELKRNGYEASGHVYNLPIDEAISTLR